MASGQVALIWCTLVLAFAATACFGQSSNIGEPLLADAYTGSTADAADATASRQLAELKQTLRGLLAANDAQPAAAATTTPTEPYRAGVTAGGQPFPPEPYVFGADLYPTTNQVSGLALLLAPVIAEIAVVLGAIAAPVAAPLAGSVQGAEQGPVQGVPQGAIQAPVQGAIQGVVQGAVQGVVQGLVMGEVVARLTDLLTNPVEGLVVDPVGNSQALVLNTLRGLASTLRGAGAAQLTGGAAAAGAGRRLEGASGGAIDFEALRNPTVFMKTMTSHIVTMLNDLQTK